MAATPSYGVKSSIGATALALVSSATYVKSGVVIKASAANGTGIVYVGNDSSVLTTTGFSLGANEQVSLDSAWIKGSNGYPDLQNIYVIGSTTGLIVQYWFV